MTAPAIPRFTEVPGLADYLTDLTRHIGSVSQPQRGSQPYDSNLQALSAPFGLTAAGLALLDDANVAAQLTTLGITPFVNYAPTFTGLGTVTGASVWSARLNDRLSVYGKCIVGTPTAVEARMMLGFNGVNANVNSDAAKVPSIMQAGTGIRGAGGAFSHYVLMESNLGYVTFGVQSVGNSGLVKANGSTLFTAGDVFMFNFSVPISGW